MTSGRAQPRCTGVLSFNALTTASAFAVTRSISAKATDAEKETAKKFFETAILDLEEQKAWIGSGNIPIAKGSDSLISGADADWLKFQYATASGAKSFVQSWDQALPPTQAEVLLDSIAKLFQLSISPQQFAANLNAVIGK